MFFAISCGARKLQTHSQAAERCFCQSERAPIKLRDIAHNSKSQSAARHGFVQALAALNSLGQLFWRQPRTVILDRELKPAAIQGRHFYRNAASCPFARI